MWNFEGGNRCGESSPASLLASMGSLGRSTPFGATQHIELQNPPGPGFHKVTPLVNMYFEDFVRCSDCAEMSICPVTK